MRKPRCYVIYSKSSLDMSSAAIYGDLVPIYPEPPRSFFNTSMHANYIKKILAGAGSSDYLMMTGNVTLVAIAFGVLYEKFGYVNVLLYDIRNNVYQPRVIPRHQLQLPKEGE